MPPVTFWLIAVNVLVQIAMRLLPPDTQDTVVNAFGFDPATLRRPLTAMAPLTLLTYQFLHGGWDHLGVNMVSLLAFGSGIEQTLGRTRYIVLYLVAGIAGALTQAIFTPAGQEGVLIGASASISGLFGVLISLWNFQAPGGRGLGILPMALLWIGLLTLTGILGIGAEGMPVAWVAHIGGFLTGLLYGLAMRAGPKP